MPGRTMTPIIRLNANLQAPDFTKIKPPFNAQNYQINCGEFESQPALKNKIRQRFTQKGAIRLINTGFKDLSQLDHWGNANNAILNLL